MAAMTRRKGRKRGGVYVWRTKKPGSILGLPASWCAGGAVVASLTLHLMGGWWFFGLAMLMFSGTHFAYVGETTSFYHRERQHRGNQGTTDEFIHTGKPWADLNAKIVFRIPMPTNASWRWTKRLQKVWMRTVETGVIFLTWPVYNDAKNQWNPRRIPRPTAVRQREARDSRGWSLNFRPHHAIMVATLAALLLLKIGGAF